MRTIRQNIHEAYQHLDEEQDIKVGSISLGPEYKEEDYDAVVDNNRQIRANKHKLVPAKEISEGDVIFVTVQHPGSGETTAVKATVEAVDHEYGVGEVRITINDGITFVMETNDQMFLTTSKK
jgi:hypothetical protein